MRSPPIWAEILLASLAGAAIFIAATSRHARRRAAVPKPDLADYQTALFFDRLISQVDPHSQTPTSLQRHYQILAGRWLALQRLGLDLTIAYIAEQSGLLANTLLLLETGLADETMASSGEWEQLAVLLGGEGDDLIWMKLVIAVALGQPGAADAWMLERIEADLRHTIADSPAARPSASAPRTLPVPDGAPGHAPATQLWCGMAVLGGVVTRILVCLLRQR